MGLLIGCLVVCLGNDSRYIPWAWFWSITTVIVGAIFVVQTIRDSHYH